MYRILLIETGEWLYTTEVCPMLLYSFEEIPRHPLQSFCIAGFDVIEDIVRLFQQGNTQEVWIQGTNTKLSMDTLHLFEIIEV